MYNTWKSAVNDGCDKYQFCSSTESNDIKKEICYSRESLVESGKL